MSSDGSVIQLPCIISVIGLNVVSSGTKASAVAKRLCSDQAELGAEERQVLSSAAVIIGSLRQLAAVEHIVKCRVDAVLCIELPKLAQLKALLDAHAHSTVALLASGDPLLYGIGRWLGKQFTQSRLRFYPAISSVQLACSRVGLSWQDINIISLHGRPVESLRTQLHGKAKLMVLTDAQSHPTRLARECVESGFITTHITVFENLGYATERVRQFAATDLLLRARVDAGNAVGDHVDVSQANTDTLEMKGSRFSDLNIVLLELDSSVSDPVRRLPVFPGIPDHLFATGAAPGKGMISKREVRLAILSFLQPGSDEVIWDVGAGCGSVAIELAYWNPRTIVHAIEHHAVRLGHLHTNRLNFGVVKNLNIVQGHAPQALTDLPRPDKVFIGGSDGKLDSLLSLAWSELPSGGLLVVSAVTESTRHLLVSFARKLNKAQVQSVEMLIKRGELQADGMEYTGKLPVEIFCFQK